jgi:hypothetical protein
MNMKAWLSFVVYLNLVFFLIGIQISPVNNTATTSKLFLDFEMFISEFKNYLTFYK